MLRNREMRRFAALLAVLAAGAAALGFALSAAAGVLVLAASAAFSAAFFAFTHARYARLARLSEQINRVLHHEDRLELAEPEEGELSILQSELTKMTLRIREQNEALRAEKVRLSDSLADIAHQLRTPLTAANLVLARLAAEPDAVARRALAREAEALLSRMDWLLTALLRLSRLDAGVVTFAREPVSVDALFREALRPLQIPLELHGITVRTEAPAGASVAGDAGWLAEALRNLLKNAMESAGEGGRIELCCTDTPLYTELTLRDSGPGFSQADLPRLFDRFYRGKDAGAAGYGIGLALCKQIITRQGGSIAAKNHPQGGALFVIRFPK